MFGDILSDEAAMLTGSIGMLPSASLNSEKQGMYEPCHGSAPDIAGKNLANPTSVILAAIQMLEYLNMGDKAEKIRSALKEVIETGDRTTRVLGGQAGTTEFTDAVLERL